MCYHQFSKIKLSKDRSVITCDVSGRDGIGVEIYRDDELVVDVFRNDTEKTRTITVFKKDIAIELMEEAIRLFKKESLGTLQNIMMHQTSKIYSER